MDDAASETEITYVEDGRLTRRDSSLRLIEGDAHSIGCIEEERAGLIELAVSDLGRAAQGKGGGHFGDPRQIARV